VAVAVRDGRRNQATTEAATPRQSHHHMMERDGWRERARETERQRERQRDRERETERETHTQRETHTERRMRWIWPATPM
jgi:hypothetical protein